MAMFEFRRRSTRRRWVFIGTGTTLVAALLLIVAAATANLAGSTFEGNDGNLVVNTTGNTDWANVAGRNTGIDKASGSSDNAFGQGTKEDNANATVVTGSIPPNKNDLTRFYEASEQGANGHIYLYLGWERLVNIGNANLDFEINQNATTGFTPNTTGPVTINRTAGDLLVTYDFGGSGTPTLGLNTWLTAGAGNTASQCLSANALPCWGNHVTLAGTVSEGAVNTGTIAEPIAGGNLGAGLFGEAAIDLTAAGVFPPGVCEAFGSAFVKSRSSSSFTAELKDFIAPIAVNISNCGSITIHKVTENGDSSFGYTTTGGLSPSTFSLSNGGSRTFDALGSGSYSVTENLTGAQTTAGWTFKSLVCTSAGSGTSTSASGTTASITLGNGGTVDCTYTNHINKSPTISTLLSATSVAVGSTVHDSATLSGATSNAGGTVTYTVYTDSACTLGAQSAGTKTVTNGVVPDSNGITFNSAGDFYWQAVYSGDGNNNSATSVCTDEHLVVNKAQPGIGTAQNLLPNDDATISGGFGTPGGTVTFKLFSPSDANCSGVPAYSQSVTVSGNGTYSTTNTTFFASVEGTWRWLVSYSGDGNNEGATSACGVEHFTIDNG
jgi:hypothetical protein